MRVRLGILVLGVMLGLVCKWAFSGGDKKDKVDAAPNSQQPAAIDRSHDPANTAQSPNVDADPLVPPAKIEGVLVSAEVDTADYDSETNSLSPFLAPDYHPGERAMFEPHGEQVCASGCAVSRHPTRTLTQSHFHQLIERFAHEPIAETSAAFEELLYYGRQTREMLRKHGTGSLDDERASVLRHELARDHARISFRVVDETGQVRSSLPPTVVPLDRRHVFSMDVHDLQPLIISGTVKRVGLDHLWNRL